LRTSGVPPSISCRRLSFGRLLPLFACASLTLASCRHVGPSPDASALRVGVFAADASSSPEQLAARYQPLDDYLEERLARPVTLVVARDAGRIVADFEAGRLDVVSNRAFGFPHAQARTGAVPLVTRREDRQATTVFLALATDPRRSLQDFHDARFDFSVRLGSSYVMGRHYLQRQGIDAERFFREVHFTNVAEDAIDRLKGGQADLCVVNSQALQRMFASGRLRSSDVKVVAETPPHAGQLWFASSTLPPETRVKLRDAFLALTTETPEHARVLAVLGATAYLPSSPDDYLQLTELMREMQLLEADLSQMP